MMVQKLTKRQQNQQAMTSDKRQRQQVTTAWIPTSDQEENVQHNNDPKDNVQQEWKGLCLGCVIKKVNKKCFKGSKQNVCSSSN